MSFSIPLFILKLVIQIAVKKGVKALDSRPEKEKLGSTVAYRDIEEHDSLIIFLHGFTGSPSETFKNIPELLVADNKLDGYDIISVGYSSRFMPDIAAGIWAADPDINNLSEYFKTLMETRFSNYNKICIVAHSMGGLVAQKGILKLSKIEFKKITHLIMFGTPSGGLDIANFRIAKRLKRQIKNLGSSSDFIIKLRKEWTDRFNGVYPFEFKSIAGLSDEFISRESSLLVFQERYRYQIDGNHSTMIKANSTTDLQNPCYRLLISDLSPVQDDRFVDNSLALNKFIAANLKTVNELDDNIPSLDAKGLKKLVLALDSLSRDDDAISILKSHELSKTNTDIMGIIGGRYKRKYLFYGSKSTDALESIEWYLKAYDRAVEANDKDQIYYHAINLAFMSIVFENNKSKMKMYAEVALENCNENTNNLWEIATIAEANIYLQNELESKKYYKKVLSITKDKIRMRSSIYLNAKFAYEALTGVEY